MFVGRRFLEYFLSEIAISSVFAFLFYKGIIPQTNEICFWVMAACLVVNLIFLTNCLTGYIVSVYDIENTHVIDLDYKDYYKVNLTVFFVFALINLGMAIINIEPAYTFLFLIYKLLTPFGLGKVLSAITVHAVMLLWILIIPELFTHEKIKRG